MPNEIQNAQQKAVEVISPEELTRYPSGPILESLNRYGGHAELLLKEHPKWTS